MEGADLSAEALRGFVLWLTGVGVPTLSAALWYTHRRISEVREGLIAELHEMQRDVEARSAESRSDREKLWEAYRALSEKVLTALRDIPNRAEMDNRLGASEARITNVIRNGGRNGS